MADTNCEKEIRDVQEILEVVSLDKCSVVERSLYVIVGSLMLAVTKLENRIVRLENKPVDLIADKKSL